MSLRPAIFVALLLMAGDRLLAAPLDWKSGPNFRSASLVIPTNGHSGFSLLAPASTGITFTNHLADRTVARNRVYENGSGVALGDVDGDGWCDIYFCRLEGPNVLYRNLGNWRFEDITERAGVACPDQFSTGAVFADIDGDGDLDLLVNAIGGGTRAFLNDGHAHFTELTGTRLVRRFGSTSMALADIDGDGDLDLYVTNYRTDTYKDRPAGLKVEARMVDGKVVVTPEDRFIPVMPREGAVEVIEMGERDFLYLNDGMGRFAPVSWTAGSFLDEDGKPLTAPPRDWGLSVMFRDIDGDGTPDIYVCNDFFYSPDRVWINQNSRGFRAIARTALRNMSLASMAVDFADINRDGFDDILVVDMLSRSHRSRQRQRPNMLKGLINPPITDPSFRPEVPRNTFFLNRGDGTYAEIAQLSGLAATEWSWGAIFLDVDLDGYEDLLITTGNSHDVQDADALRQIATVRDKESPEDRLKRFPRLETENLAFRNRGDLTFENVSAQWGFNLVGVSHGMALADLDNDGDLDVVVNNLNAAAAIYRNETVAPRVAIRLKGTPPNTRGIGAKLRVFGGPVAQSQEMICGGRYLSCDDTIRVFAAGTPTNELRIEVTWRNGRRSIINGAKPNHVYEIEEAGSEEVQSSKFKVQSERSSVVSSPLSVARGREHPTTDDGPRTTDHLQPLFEDVSHLLGHTNIDQPFDDFSRQPLLVHRLSQLGPGLAWVDFDSDGFEDLIIGSGRGGRLTFFRNDGHGSFTRQEKDVASQDQTSVLSWTKEPTNCVVLVGSANYEDGYGSKSVIREYSSDEQIAPALAASLETSLGPMAMSDVDGDGNLDLFAGARVAGGRYPAPVSSKLYRNVAGLFQLDQTNSMALEKLGMVSGAVFSDLDGDGDGDLILACEWGPIRVFRNDSGKLLPWNLPLAWPGDPSLNDRLSTLDSLTGWWNGVTTGDFDGDGRMDIVITNWGRNSKYQAVLKHGLRLYYGDYDSNGTIEGIEAYFDRETNKVVPWRDFETMASTLPFIRENIMTFREYGNASVQEMLGAKWPVTTELTANILDSMVLLNRGDHFEARPLPEEAQFAPSFGVAVSDYDGDGNEDIFLAQNFFGVEPETARYDGGRGLLLKGDGKGNFTAVPGQVSGIKIYGEQRGCAAADYDGDGRVDLVVAQNNGPTRLYRNAGGRPGLRVRLSGPNQNPSGIGAIIRIKFANRMGPAREVHAGSGYWSQDGLTQVFGIPESPTSVWVRWPGGKETVTAIEPETRFVRIEYH